MVITKATAYSKMKDSKYLLPKRGNDVGVDQKWKRCCF
jgi:hypothetical protein